MELNGIGVGTLYDQLDVTGTVTLTNPTLNVSLGYSPSPNQVFTIIKNDGSDAVNGTFNGLAEASIFSIGNQRFRVSYVGGDGNDVTLTALLRIDTWTGLGGDNKWSTAANWVSGFAPVANDQLVFPVGAAQTTNVNDIAAGTSFDSFIIAGAGYNITGNGIDLGHGITASYSSGSSTFGLDIDLYNNSQTIDVATGGTLVLPGVISGNFDVLKAGGGNLTVSGTNTYVGNTLLNAGTLTVSGSLAALGTGRITVTSGATLGMSGTASLANPITIGGTGVGGLGAVQGSVNTNTLHGDITLTADTSFDSSTSFRFFGAIGGAFGITTTGTGTFNMYGSTPNTYTGTTNLQGSFFIAAKDAGVTSIPGNVVITSGALILGADNQIANTASVTLSDSSATLDLSGFSDTINTLTFTGGAVTTGTGALSAGGVATNPASTTATISGNFNLNGATATFDIADGSADIDLSILAIISNGGFSNEGAGTLALSGMNTYAGGTSVKAGRVQASNNSSFGTGVVAVKSQVDLFNNLLIANNFTIDSTDVGLTVHGLTTLTGTVGLLSDSVISVDEFANLFLNGVVSGTGGLFKAGGGTLGLGSANTYQGGTTVNAGQLQIFNGQSTGTIGAVTVGTGATLIQSTNAYTLPSSGLVLSTGSTYLVPLPSSESLSGPITLAGVTTFTIAPEASLTVLGTIDGGSASLGKNGAGVLVLSGTSSYTGTTSVMAGTLVANGDLSSSSMIDVQPGATLGGSGNLGQTSIGNTAIFAPGDSPSTINVLSLALDSGSTFIEELFGNAPGNGTTGYDKTIVSTGPLTLNGATLSLNLGGGYVPSNGDVLTIIDNQSANPVGGTFLSLPEGSLLNIGGSTLRLSYVGGNGNDVTLTTISSTSTAFSSSPNPSIFGQSVTLTAMVAAVGINASTPTGSVTFLDGSTVLGTSQLNPSGVAILSMTGLSAGIHGITVEYTATGNFFNSTSPLVIIGVNTATTTLTLSNVPISTVVGQSVQLTAVVGVNSPGNGTPTGSVWFLEGQTVLGVVALSPVSGQQTAVFTTSALPVGTHTIAAQYGGNSSFTASPMVPLSLAVSKAGASTTLTGGGTTGLGQSATFTAAVSAVAPGAGTPTGTVTFFDGSTSLGTVELSGGTATFMTSSLVAGAHAISASYTLGDANFSSGATSLPVTQTVITSASTIVVSSSAPTSVYGQPVTLTAYVLPANPNAGPVTGTVAFRDGGVLLGYAAVNGGVASLTLNTINPGARSITAVYSGNDSVTSSQETLTQVVSPANTTTTVSVQSVKTWFRRTSTLYVRVKSQSPGTIPPTGTAFIYMNGRLFRSVQVVNGVATVSIPYSNRFRSFGAVFQSNTYFVGGRSGVGQAMSRSAFVK